MYGNNSATVVEHKGEIQKAMLYILAAMFILFINSMTIVSYFLRKKSKRVIPDVFMLSLAVSSIVTMLAVILILAYVRATGNEFFVGLKPLCYIQVYFGTWLRVTDVSITTAITIDRFLALYKPLIYRTKVKLKHGKIVSVVIWTVSAIVAMLPLVGFGQISMHMQSFCTADWSSDISYVVLSMAYVQFIIVLICYIGIFRAISGLVNRQKSMAKSQSLSYSTVKREERENVESEINRLDLSNDGISNLSFDKDEERKGTYVNSVFENEDALKDRTKTDSIQRTTIQIDTKVKIKTTVKRKISTEIAGIFKKKRSSKSYTTVKAENRVTWHNISELDERSSCEGTTEGSFESISNATISKETHCKNKITKSVSDNIGISLTAKKPPLGRLVSNLSTSSQFTTVCETSSSTDKKKTFRSFNLRSISDRLGKRNRFLKRSSSTTSIRSFWRESQRFAKVMGIVVLIFYISWLPLAISINVVLVKGLEHFINNYYNILWLSYNISLISSVAIPISYAMMCKPYRASYRVLLKWMRKSINCCCSWKKQMDIANSPAVIKIPT